MVNDEDGNSDYSYYTIEEHQILLNEEVDEFLETTTWDNSETHILSIDEYHCQI